MHTVVEEFASDLNMLVSGPTRPRPK